MRSVLRCRDTIPVPPCVGARARLKEEVDVQATHVEDGEPTGKVALILAFGARARGRLYHRARSRSSPWRFRETGRPTCRFSKNLGDARGSRTRP
jgi:hypothetical protein